MKLSALEKRFGRKPQTVIYPQKWMIVWWLSHTSYLYLNNGYLFYVHTLKSAILKLSVYSMHHDTFIAYVRLVHFIGIWPKYCAIIYLLGL